MKTHDDKPLADCSYCGGLHYGSPSGECVFQCVRCQCDTRKYAVEFGHKKCSCSEVPQIAAPKRICPHNTLRKIRDHRYTFSVYVCGSCSTIFQASEYVVPERPTEPREFAAGAGLSVTGKF